MDLDNIIQSLNAPQQEAVAHLGSPLLILAGPGSGKTRVVTVKIAWLIQALNIYPSSILAMTFTNKAAKEMQERVQLFTAESEVKGKPYISTFHSFGAYVLRLYHVEAGLPRDFQIYDTQDQLALLKEINPTMKAPQLREILSNISKAKDSGLSAGSPLQELDEFFQDVSYDSDVSYASFYLKYETLKQQTGNVDFGDLLIKPYELIRDHDHIKEKIKNRWKWFFVDEYQDTNTVQSKFLHTLCHHTANLTVVGDDDQSIYKFRGAVVDNILNFEKLFDHTKIVRLNQNYRSTNQIINLANQLITHNTKRYEKGIFSENPEGALPQVRCFAYNTEEAQYLVAMAQEVKKHNQELAIFYRVNSQSREYEMALRKAQIPYVIIGSVEFFERAEIKDAMALLRLYKNANDIVSFLRIANKPTKGLGKTTLARISKHMQEGMNWSQAWHYIQGDLSKKAIDGLRFLEHICKVGKNNDAEIPLEVQDEATSESEHQTIGDVLRALLEISGLWNWYKEEDEKRYTDRIDNLEEIISFAMDFGIETEDWDTFFEQVSLNEREEDKPQDNPVQLMTLHKSKGLEFDNVVICGLEDSLIPLSRGFINEDEMEEERRLLYVGFTRAKERLVLTRCYNRTQYGRTESTVPSPFLNDFDKSVVEWIEAESNSVAHGDEYARWKVGDRVYHTQYGKGYIQRVQTQNSRTMVHIEFDIDYEASFIPKYTQELTKEEESYS